MHAPLSPRQCEILYYLAAYQKAYGCPPTYREIARRLETCPSVAYHNVGMLEKADLVKRRRGGAMRQARTLTLTAKGRALVEQWQKEERDAQVPQLGRLTPQHLT